jgi:hypothetical protein
MIKKIIATAVLSLSAIALAAPAGAESNPITEFFSDISDAGFSVTKSNEPYFLIAGLGICVDLLSGTPMQVEFAQVVNELGLTEQKAANLIKAAVVDLCPTAAATSKA